jgi:hypothetical protein
MSTPRRTKATEQLGNCAWLNPLQKKSVMAWRKVKRQSE